MGKKWKRRIYDFLKTEKGDPDSRAREDLWETVGERDSEKSAGYLNRLLDFAKRHVPYYADLLAGRDDWAGNLRDIPVLTKQIVHDNFERLKSDDIGRRKTVEVKSGGTTGNPQIFIQDRSSVLWSEACSTHYKRKIIGIEDFNVPQLRLRIHDEEALKELTPWRARLKNWLRDYYVLDSLKLTPEIARSYVRTINKIQPVFIKAGAGILYRLAQFIGDNNFKVHSPQFVIAFMETLHPHMRSLLEQVFKTKVFDFYGVWEARTIGGTCRKGTMHFFDNYNWLEVVDENNRPAKPGETGKILLTTLHNHAMPLIRYEVGDMAIMGDGCSCGSPLPTLKRLLGRNIDYFTNPSGEMIRTWYFIILLENRSWIREFQILQKDFDHIEIFYIKKSEPVKAEVREIEEKTRALMGKDCRIDWIETDHIATTPQGKIRWTHSLVTKR